MAFKKYLYFTVAFFIFSINISNAQFPLLNAAKDLYYASITPQDKLTNLLAVCKFRNSLHSDSIYVYANLIKQLALQLNDKKSLAVAEYNFITGDMVNGKTDSVIYKIDNNPAFKNLKLTDTSLYFKCQYLKANALNRQNKRTEALDLQLQLLNEAEKTNNTNAQLFALTFIGATYINVNKANEARDTWNKGLVIIAQKNDPANQEIDAYINSNLALYYFNQYGITPNKPNSDSFFMVINKTISLATQSESMGVLAAALTMRANFYGIIKNITEAEKDFKAGLEIREKINDPLYIINDYIGLANFYFGQKKYDLVINTCNQGLSIAEKSQIKGGEPLTLLTLMGMAFKAQNNYLAYSQVLEKFNAAKDSSNKINANEKISEIQTKYDVIKKEALISKQKLGLFQKNLYIFGSLLLTVLLGTIGLYKFKKYQSLQKTKAALIANQEKTDKDIAIKQAEDKERKRIGAELHDNLGIQANAILHNSNLLHASNNQNETIVTNLQYTAKEMLRNLRETLWAMKQNDVTATELWIRIISFMKQMSKYYENINFTFDGVAPADITIISSRALHIVLVIQETVNNAIKHAKANNINVSSNFSNNIWAISITDNGIGFNIASIDVTTDHYGLKNMEDRAIAGNFKYSINSEINQGTKTNLEIS
jgi:signal transduction histidine kinase